jgi:hypothetical protein
MPLSNHVPSFRFQTLPKSLSSSHSPGWTFSQSQYRRSNTKTPRNEKTLKKNLINKIKFKLKIKKSKIKEEEIKITGCTPPPSLLKVKQTTKSRRNPGVVFRNGKERNIREEKTNGGFEKPFK